MSQQQSDTHGPAIDDALNDQRRTTSAGTRHEGAPEDDPIFQDEAVQDPPDLDQDPAHHQSDE